MPRWGWSRTQQLLLLERVAASQLQRARTCGDLEPVLADGCPVSGQLSWLALRGWVVFDLLGEVHLTRRGLQALLRDALEQPGLPWQVGQSGDRHLAHPT